MYGVLALDKRQFTGELMKERNEYVNLNRTSIYIIKSDHSPIKSIFFEFDMSKGIEGVVEYMKKQISEYLDTIPFNHIAATVWNDAYTCVVSIYPLIGAA